MPRRSRGPKNTWPQQKRHALQVLGKKRLSPLRAQRKAMQAMLAKKLGYEQARLSSQFAKPGNYTRTGTALVTGKGGVAVKERFIVKKHHKAGQGKGGGSADRSIIHKTGTMTARKSQAKAGKKGMRPGREPKKKPKKT